MSLKIVPSSLLIPMVRGGSLLRDDIISFTRDKKPGLSSFCDAALALLVGTAGDFDGATGALDGGGAFAVAPASLANTSCDLVGGAAFAMAPASLANSSCRL